MAEETAAISWTVNSDIHLIACISSPNHLDCAHMKSSWLLSGFYRVGVFIFMTRSVCFHILKRVGNLQIQG